MNSTILQPYSWAEIEQKLGLPPFTQPKPVQAKRQNLTRHDTTSIPELIGAFSVNYFIMVLTTVVGGGVACHAPSEVTRTAPLPPSVASI